jgi:hypothetical protein
LQITSQCLRLREPVCFGALLFDFQGSG